MKDAQWVQHISGQGKKWKVHSEGAEYWAHHQLNAYYNLPKSEYRLCDTPAVWRDCTADVSECGLYKQELFLRLLDGYRLRKVQVHIEGFPKWAFIVERTEPA
jgi:hypothetical protein